eukprot:10967702-Prorocentrum_lima.AAC.1
MTSSLVGSEMCIRDRMYESCGMQQAMDISMLSEQNHQARALIETISNHCLLYTSDAADDM